MVDSFSPVRDDFVDREDEMTRFRAMLDGTSPRILCIHGRGGMGKSSLQAEMIQEVQRRCMPRAHIVWTETRPYGYLGVMRKVRDDIDPRGFKPLTDLINYFTVARYELDVRLHGASRLSALQNATMQNSAIGNISNVTIQDLRLDGARPDMAVPEDERMMTLTDSFLECLAKITTDRLTVLFFDATEKMRSETWQWLHNELLHKVCSGDLPFVRVVLCGRNAPEMPRAWRGAAEALHLQGLSKEHIEMYIARRGVNLESISFVDLLDVASSGNTLQLALLIDYLAESPGDD